MKKYIELIYNPKKYFATKKSEKNNTIPVILIIALNSIYILLRQILVHGSNLTLLNFIVVDIISTIMIFVLIFLLYLLSLIFIKSKIAEFFVGVVLSAISPMILSILVMLLHIISDFDIIVSSIVSVVSYVLFLINLFFMCIYRLKIKKSSVIVFISIIALLFIGFIILYN